jgi:hypothetical protein
MNVPADRIPSNLALGHNLPARQKSEVIQIFLVFTFDNNIARAGG